jgi:hypothetical protein
MLPSYAPGGPNRNRLVCLSYPYTRQENAFGGGQDVAFMHALSQPIGSIRVSLEGLRTVLGRMTAVMPVDARVRLVRIAGVRHGDAAGDLASVDELAALSGLPDILYDLSVSVVASAQRTPERADYRVQLVSDDQGLNLQVFSTDAVWTHGAIVLLRSELAEFKAETPAECPSPGASRRPWKPLLAGALSGAAIASAYYRSAWAGAALAGLGAFLWYLIDLIFAVTTPAAESRETPNLHVVIRDVATFAPARRTTAFAVPAVRFVVVLAAVAFVVAVMMLFFPHQIPASTAPHAARR